MLLTQEMLESDKPIIIPSLSVKQPWANLICDGVKPIETRTWETKYRGDLLICSSKTPAIQPSGMALCIVELYDIKPMSISDETEARCKIYDNAYSWMLKNLRRINPLFPVKGQLRIFETELPSNIKILPVDTMDRWYNEGGSGGARD